MSEPFISVRALRKTYGVRRGLVGASVPLHAVAGLSFEVSEGTTFGLVGESGSGKTTTAKMVMGAEEPTSGTIRVGGLALVGRTSEAENTLRRMLQPVLQDPYSSLSPRMRLGRIIDEPLRIHRVLRSRRELDRRVGELLELVGLSPAMARRYPHELSGGQRQRVAIARALSLQPRCIVLDEPVSALDVSIQAQILNLLKDLQTELKLTYLLISHDLAVVGYMSATIGVLYLGQMVEYGPRDAILRDARHPYTLALISTASPTASNLTTVQGEIPSPLSPPSGCPFHTRCPIARDRCRVEKPELASIGPNHRAACHFIDTSRAELGMQT
jgi:peptide/nickel transport system ATP-binding protein/oligopeptide transport system ATP-binding protein